MERLARWRGSRDPYAAELETWLYLLMDLYGRNFLPWNEKQCSFEETPKWKKQFFLCPQLLPQHFWRASTTWWTSSTTDEYENNKACVLKRRLLVYMKQEHISRYKPFGSSRINSRDEPCQENEEVQEDFQHHQDGHPRGSQGAPGQCGQQRLGDQLRSSINASLNLALVFLDIVNYRGLMVFFLVYKKTSEKNNNQ